MTVTLINVTGVTLPFARWNELPLELRCSANYTGDPLDLYAFGLER